MAENDALNEALDAYYPLFEIEYYYIKDESKPYIVNSY